MSHRHSQFLVSRKYTELSVALRISKREHNVFEKETEKKRREKI